MHCLIFLLLLSHDRLTMPRLTSISGFKLVYRDCANQPTFKQTDRCELRSNEFSYTTFKYGDSCCYTTGLQGNSGTTYSMSVCFCQKDNCNGNIPLTLAPPATTTKPTNAVPSLKPSIAGYLELFAMVLMVLELISGG